MQTCTVDLLFRATHGRSESLPPTLVSRPALFHWVTAHDLETLSEALAKGELPSSFRYKLATLAGGDLSHRFIEQHCRLFAALLTAVADGSFRAGSREERERLLRVLAYVQKDEDAIPDYRPAGFSDDQIEVRAATSDLGGLLGAFKAWRLCHQVPAMWHSAHAA